jgi:hypothetical protein
MHTQAREHFNTYKCTNKYRDLNVWRLCSRWTVADECWTTITDKGHELTHWFRIGLDKTMSGLTGLEIVIWRLHVIFAWI